MRDALPLALLTLAAFALRLGVLIGEEPLGTDGYYYVVQIEDWASTGALHVPDSSWVLRLLALPHLLGADATTSLALIAALLAATVVPPAWLVGHSGGRTSAWIAALLAAASPTLTHLAGDFPKNLGVAAPWLAAIAAAQAGLGGRRWAWPAAAVLAALASTAHRLGAVWVLLAAVGLLVHRIDRRLALRLLSLGVVVGLFVTIAAGVPGLLHPEDLHRLDGQLRTSPWPPPPWSWLPLRHTHPTQQLELALPWLAVVLLPWAARVDRASAAMLALPLAPALFPLWSADGLDLGYRVSLLGPLAAGPLLALATGAWLEAQLDASSLGPGGRRWIVGLGVLALPAATTGFDPASTPPYARYRALIAQIPKPRPPLVIAHQGINFLYDHLTGDEAMAWAPEPELDRASVGRIAWGIRAGEWLAVSGPDTPPVIPLGQGYSYVREDLWEALIAHAIASGDEELLERISDRRNPTTVRPAALTRGRAP